MPQRPMLSRSLWSGNCCVTNIGQADDYHMMIVVAVVVMCEKESLRRARTANNEMNHRSEEHFRFIGFAAQRSFHIFRRSARQQIN